MYSPQMSNAYTHTHTYVVNYISIFLMWILSCRRSDCIAVPGVHAIHSESVPEEGADLRARVDFRKGGGLCDGQVRQEARQGELPPELRDALPLRDRVSLQVRQRRSLVYLTLHLHSRLSRTTPPFPSWAFPPLPPLFLAWPLIKFHV